MTRVGLALFAALIAGGCACGLKDAPLAQVDEGNDRPAKVKHTGKAPGQSAAKLTLHGEHAAEESTEKPLLLGSLCARDHSVRIYTGHRYTIEDAVGNVLAEFLSEPEFQARFPLVFDDLREALADDGTWAGTDYGQDRALCFPKPGVEIQGIETKTDAVRPAPSTSP